MWLFKKTIDIQKLTQIQQYKELDKLNASITISIFYSKVYLDTKTSSLVGF